MENKDLSMLRHTTSHIMAQAIKRLYPNANLAIGPSIENGFYYDIDLEQKLSPDDFAAIEKEMKKIIAEKLPIVKEEVAKEKAFERVKGNPYKTELIEALTGKITFYTQGEFCDLCAGPHLDNTGEAKAFKLTSMAGAYWRGDEKNKMLQRIYGTAFFSEKELTDYLAAVEEAIKRNHNKLGRELEIFTTVDEIGQGLPILLPKGSKIMQILRRFVEDEEEKRGYLLTITPLLAKSDLYKISGHWQHYKDGMFVLGDEKKDKEVFALRPMTCPFQFQAYLNKTRSYRDLPLRYNETSTLFRNESSGEMHGLIRVRQFTISEGHIACTKEQLENEFKGCLELVKFMLKTLGFENDASFRFSKWDENNKEKYVGSAPEWNAVQTTMKEILDNLDVKYTEAEGEAAFYGPKLDIQMKNVYGKEDTLITIQIDFQLAKKFGMEYTDSDGTKKFPYVIHRTSIGCYERVLALLIEKYAGKFPLWLSPTQVRLMPITDAHLAYANSVKEKLEAAGIRVEVDSSSEKFGAKVREFIVSRIPYGVIIGDKEMNDKVIAVRSRDTSEQKLFNVDEFVSLVAAEIKNRNLKLGF